jgi:DNA-directed RNA polymerase subunit RPC12/RpoP
MSVAFVCDSCEAPVYARPDGTTGQITCAACGQRHLLQGVTPDRPAGALERCLRCGLDRLYVQKDFNRKIGLAVFAVAALLSVPTWGLSLLVATLIDLGLYFLLGDVTICYGCNTQHRGFARNPAHGAFDLHVAEAIDNQPRALECTVNGKTTRI